MPFRISIPLPGPVSWSPPRRKKRPKSNMTQEDWQVLADGLNRGLERTAERLDRFGQRVDDANERSRVRHERGMAELEKIRKLPPVARFKAAMRFRP